MPNHAMASSSSQSYNPNHGAANLEITELIVICEFLDPLRAIANVGAIPEIQNSHSSPISALRPGRSNGNTSAPPVNASMIGSSSNGRDKWFQSQWQFLLWFIWKIDDYCQKLREYRNQILPTHLGDWVAEPNLYKQTRSVGLRALGDISCGNTPSELHEMLSAMIVQHTISHYTRRTNSFEDSESAFVGWRNAIPLMKSYQRSFDVVFERLKAIDMLSLGNAQQARPTYQTSVFETGQQFQSELPYYPQAINENSLYHTSSRGHPDSNQTSQLWGLAPESDFTSRPDDGYSASYSLDHSQALGTFISYPQAASINGPFPSNEVDAYSTFPQQNDLRGLPQTYGLPQTPNYTDRGTQTTSLALNQTPPFNNFTKFVSDFKNQGGLLELFSHQSIHQSDPIPNSNARVSEILFFSEADSTFFDPLRKSLSSQPSQNAAAQAIISATRARVLHGGLRSYSDVVKYTLKLSTNLLPTYDACHTFVRSVLQISSNASRADELGKSMGNLGRTLREDEILKSYNGAYYPVCLLGVHGTSRRTLPPRQSTRATRTSNSRAAPSIIYSSGSTGLNFADNDADMSVVSEPFIHSQSSIDAHAYPTNPRTTNTSSVTSTAQCSECGKQFSGRNVSSHLSRHKRQHLDGDKTIPCPVSGCTKIFRGSRTDNIRAHCWNVHKERLPEDGKAFWSSRAQPPES